VGSDVVELGQTTALGWVGFYEWKPPLLVVEIPARGVSKAQLEVHGGMPIKLRCDLGLVDAIAQIVTRPIGHERNQRPARVARGQRQCEFIDQTAERLRAGERCQQGWSSPGYPRVRLGHQWCCHPRIRQWRPRRLRLNDPVRRAEFTFSLICLPVDWAPCTEVGLPIIDPVKPSRL